MIGSARELGARLALARRVLELSPEPLHAPLGIVFRPQAGEAHLRAWADHAARAAAGATFAPATLYVNIPFCARVCTYCLLSAVRTPGKDAVAAYVGAVRRQIALFEPLVEPLRFGSVHVGGGTPTLLDERLLDELFTDLLRLPRAPGAQIGVEAHPATSTPGRLAVLRRHGVHRLSFGVESLTPAVLRNVNREDQNEARVRAAVAEARRLGFSINIDLLAGLPGETEASWAETVEKTAQLEPDSLSVNRFLGENSALAAFGYGPDEEENRRADAMLLRADAILRERSAPRWPAEPLAQPGFGTQYVWDRSDEARTYFQDDMIGPVSTLALGHGALGHVYGRFFSVPAGSIADFVEKLGRGAPPDMLACPVDERFEMAFFAADQACRGQLSLATFQRVFRRPLPAVFPRELAFLLRRGLLAAHGDHVSKPPRADFQVTDLLAFLLHDGPALAHQARALEEAGPRGAIQAGEAPAAGDGFVEIARGGDVEALVDRSAAEGARVLRVDVGEGIDGDTATRLAAAGARKGLRVEVRGDDRRPLREYAQVRAELPPSMLWVRIAIRASQAARGEQRLVALRVPP
jgi:coproporphyrinogen III oxidase-like Fe-S oxidoreductase